MRIDHLQRSNCSLEKHSQCRTGPKSPGRGTRKGEILVVPGPVASTLVQNLLRDAKLSFKDLNEVILVGGSTCIPTVQELVKKLTGKDPNVTVNPDEVVALGAVVQMK
ncbi:hypothetical protein VNO80_28379 [Phaseolus coccineus]|uniref:Uncharacterized protein n=1 Tax=Phaseolus coccineus TaxID=3886 RepID=A0AAN9LBE5_PHACN